MTGQPHLTRAMLRATLIAAATVVALSSFYVAPHLSRQIVGSQPVSGTGGGGAGDLGGPGGAAAGPAAGGSGPAAHGAAAAAAGPQGNPSAYQCAPGRNGGKTDVGVDGGTISLASTEVESGVGASFLGPVRYGMMAVLQKVNRQGGICGRRLDLTLRDDGWDAQKGKTYIDNFIQSNQYFALAVVPSSEGLNAASKAGDIDSAPDSVGGGSGIPVVGSDGMLNSQYHDQWIWPAPASTSTSMRLIAHDAAKRHAHSFAIVYDNYYKFGIEGKNAYVAQVKRDSGSIDLSNCAIGLDPNVLSYNTQVSQFNQHCSNVDFVALLLEPQVAETWLSGNPYMGKRPDGSGAGAAGPQPLFDYGFFSSCQDCVGMQLWTSFLPPRYPFNQQGKVQQFVSDLASVDGNTNDAASAFVEGGYVGMQLLVTALQNTGPDLTRARLRATLDAMKLDSGLSAPLQYQAGNHYANLQMVAYSVTNSQGAGDVTYVQGSQQSDPCSSCQDQ